MSDNSMQTASDRLMHELTVATDASIGVIAIRCPPTEVYRVVDDIYGMASANRTSFMLHTAELGWSNYERVDPDDPHAPVFDPLQPKESHKVTADIQKAFQYLDETTCPTNGYFVMLDLYHSFAEMRTQAAIRKQVQRSLSNEQRVFLVVPQTAEIPHAIAPHMHVIEFGYPTVEELSESLDEVLKSVNESDRPEIDEDARRAILANGRGMTTNGFETAIALSITEYAAAHDDMKGFAAQDIIDMLRNYKTQLLRKTQVLELQPPVAEDEIGGLDLFKEWMNQRRMTYTDKAAEFGITPSRGALVVGPPGTGKSLVAKAAGSILNLPVIRFDVGRVFGAYVGQSEGAMRSVLTMIDAMSPCVLMLDEIDKGFAGMSGGGGNDSGTTQRVFGTFLTWMQERDQKERPVFLIMTANRVHGLPPELLRKGRVDEIWSVNVPNEDERRAIATIHAKKRNQKIGSEDMPAIIRITDKLVGAEIEALIEDSMVISLANDNPGLSYKYVEEAKGHLKPMYETREEEFNAMREWADKNARLASSPVQHSDKPGPTTSKLRRSAVGKRTVRAKIKRPTE